MIRERCGAVMERAKNGKSKHFSVDMTRMKDVFDLVMKTTKQNYPDMKIPYHSRWRHFNEPDVAKLAATWKCDDVEKARRMLDLVTVSVLLDAGAGNKWHYLVSEAFSLHTVPKRVFARIACAYLSLLVCLFLPLL
jgi:hypothetical protein